MSFSAPTIGTILVVSQHPSRLENLTATLSSRGCRVQIIGDPASAVQAASTIRPDLVLLATDMPGNGVYDLCQKLKAHDFYHDVPILFFGEPARAPDRTRLLAAGGNDYISTASRRDELVDRVELHLAVGTLHKQLAAKNAQLVRETTARKRAESQRDAVREMLIHAESRGLGLVDRLSEVIYTADVSGIVTYVSPAIEPFLGYRPAEVIGHRLDEFIYPQDLVRLSTNLHRVLGGQSVANEYRSLTKSGEVRWMRTSSQPVVEGNRVIGVQGILADSTEQKQAEIQLQQQNQFLTNVLESLTHPFYVIDAADYSVKIANSATRTDLRAGAITCYALTHHLQQPCSSIDHPCPLEEVKRTRQPARVEHTHRDNAGNERILEVYGYPLFDEKGDIKQVIEYSLDITDRKRAEESLREALQTADAARKQEAERRHEAERRRQVAEGLARVVSALNSNQTLSEVLEQIASQTRELLGNQASAVCSWPVASGRITIEVAEGLPDDELSGTIPLPYARVWHQALASHEPVVIPDLDETGTADNARTPGTDAHWIPDRLPYRAMLAVPIFVKEELYGGMMLFYTEPHLFSEEQIELATVFSGQVALAIASARLRRQAEQTAAAAERSRLARDLHDSVTQVLFSASLVAEILPQVWERDPEEAKQGLEELRELTRSALAEMRTLLLELRPAALLETKLDELLWQLYEVVISRARTVIAFNVEPAPLLPPDVQLTFYRVAQEALHNLTKYAKADHATVTLRASPPILPGASGKWRGQLVLEVSDDGCGFDPGRTGPNQLGLRIMRERSEAIAANLTIDSQHGRGTRIRLLWHKD